MCRVLFLFLQCSINFMFYKGHNIVKNQNTDLVLLTPLQMQIVDKAAAKTIPVKQLMENAGWAVTQEILKRYKPCSVLILCGPGNNGGDGYVVARLLAKAGWPVCVGAIGKPKAGSDAEYAARQWCGKTVENLEAYVEKASLVVDAIFGAGLTSNLDCRIADLLRKAKRVIAVDIPSGIDGETGQIKGYAPYAELTVSFFRAKPGHYLLPGREHMGVLVIKDISILTNTIFTIDIKYWLNEPGLWEIPRAEIEDYKYRRGAVSIIGGSQMTGAARLSAHAALNMGAGLVHILPLGNNEIYSNFSACLIVDNDPLEDVIQDERRKVWVCGPGLSIKDVRRTLPILIAAGKKVIADAGVFQTDQIDMLKGTSIITPHMGEFKRVFGEIIEDKVSAARQAAVKTGAVVVLKGADTLIVAPDGRVAINQHASARLATAGSGDTLTGIIATLLASGMPEWESACAAVWMHGEAGYLCDHSWPNAEMLANNLGKARDNAKIIKKIDN
ncbi:NAD(P)H-hydrate epimerase domain (Nnr1) (PDB:3RRB) [Commensalibacter papalotli (ex Botero et al. 2024)]|uniref:Bifunctional NAD(P)H-hydrate repair enzyme n=1 Tax=Commensalibacter papalotli (ex Botero et al. 2024) TaxID=2972766 RepID=A0ABM9HQL8_9PROT|nr:NAD(P)H-hydrate epimerase domain (Nnr1) (PDB:3RRB) [Commensalibacter papalotli (ex Botero et al. 2024)]CAI3945387.1 NAD(P)H-hydrate epimerase domain (Nnr1) (PDB:3RRB) [Commensalibacter papalotli (ex Botero et al. 2024)]